ncbi:MAG: ABC transporter ATP-binding protein [Treponema sp.]|jgi:iron complex transport system ATP-binding protein|nr:ABC transporter ATP-binding protein [Treponema sp.]
MMVLKAEHIRVSIADAHIVRDVSVRVEAGRFVGLIGPNGCGKSTLLKSVYKVLKPKNGSVFLDNIDVLSSSPRQIAKLLGVVGQFNDMSFDFTVAEMVLMGRTPHKKLMEADNADDYRIMEEALGRVDMAEYARRKFLSLSGGERQRVILARTIAQKPEVMILDEPTNHLDIKYQLQVLSVVKKLGIGALAALHDLVLVSEFCDYLYLMSHGRIVASGVPGEVLTKEVIEEVYDVACEIYTNPVTGKLGITYLI